MARTFKDKKWTLRHPENDYYFGTERISYTVPRKDWTTGEILEGTWTNYVYVDIPGAKTKKKRDIDGNWRWYQRTPSWWSRLVMNKPRRRACRVWERQVLLEDIEEADCPDYGRKPHVYFY